MPDDSELVIAEPFDPNLGSRGGVDAIVLAQHIHADRDVAILGVGRHGQAGAWKHVDLGGTRARFASVTRVDLTRRTLLPHSLHYLWGLLRHRTLWRDRTLQVHRAELSLVLSLLGHRNILFLHNTSKSLTGSSSDSKWRHFGRLYALIERSAVRRAVAVQVFSRQGWTELRQRTRSDVSRGLTGYDPRHFYAGDAEHRVSRDVTLRVAWAGRIDRQKRPELALEVATELQRTDPKVEFVMAGDGPLSQDIQRKGQDIKMAGKLAPEQLGDLFRRSDVFLMTSAYEGSPTVLVEAAACGLPVVATEGSDPDAVIKDGVNGYVVSSRPAEIAAAVRAAARLDRRECADAVSQRAVPYLAQLWATIGSGE